MDLITCMVLNFDRQMVEIIFPNPMKISIFVSMES